MELAIRKLRAGTFPRDESLAWSVVHFLLMMRGTAVRLFLTCWLLYSLHFATNIVREVYLAVSLGEDCTFRVDQFAGLHPDIFEKSGYGWHINSNPGASMMAAVPYAIHRLWINPVADRMQQNRTRIAEPPKYDSPWPLARKFYEEAWRRGLDVKLGLAAMVMQMFLMAPISAAGVVLMFLTLQRIITSNRKALWLSIVYAFGTPIFFRTGTLNQNLLIAHFLFAGFLVLWNFGRQIPPQKRNSRFLISGFCAGTCVLLDYSGVIVFALLLIYALLKHRNSLLRDGLLFVAGALPALALLWFYQWRSFGHPFYPPQYHMPAINEWVETGFRGYVFPRVDLLVSLLFDYRYGLLLSCPLLLIAPFVLALRNDRVIRVRFELYFCFAFFAVLWIFFAGVNYTHLQFNTGIRYLIAIVPFLFVPAALVLAVLPRTAMVILSVFSIGFAWCMAMYRDVERGLGILEPVIQIFRDGLQLPALTTLSRIEGINNYMPFNGSPYPFFALSFALILLIWKFRS